MESICDISLYKKLHSLGVQGGKFIIVGAATATLDFMVLYLLTDHVGLGYFVSSAIGFILGSSCNYFLSIKWVFIPGKFRQSVEFTFFMATSSIGLVINQLVMWVFVSVMLINYLVAKCFALVIVTIWNFVTKKKFVFLN